MRQDGVSLQRFYDSSLGEAAARTLRTKLTDLWGGASGLSMLGLGYSLPLLDAFAATTSCCIAALPKEYGPVSWSSTGRGNAALSVNEQRLPFHDETFDRIIVLHGLEEAASPQSYMREIWRVTAPEGRIVLAATNRAGLWARATRTPFGHGRPWSRAQLISLLSSGLFQVTASTHALHMPPIRWQLITAASEGWEVMGRLGAPGLGGVVLVEAVKRLYAKPGSGTHEPVLDRVRSRKTQPRSSRSH